MTPTDPTRPLDLAGIGIGPANLSLAALAQPTGLRAAWFEREPAFRWHPGLLIEDATLQVPFLADLVTLADPTSRWSFLNYLRHTERLYPFYFSERFHSPRAEYDAYCRWVADGVPGLHFGHRIDGVRWDSGHAVFELAVTRLTDTGETHHVTHARHLAIGIGTAPHIPGPLRHLTTQGPGPVLHSADYLGRRDALLAAGHVTVVGSGQSGAEVFLDLLRRRPEGLDGLHWLSRSRAFAPMEYSKLGLEHFTPDYTRYFHGLPEPVRDRLVTEQWQLHKAIDHDTLAAIHDELYRRTVGGGWPDAVLLPGVSVSGGRWTGGRLHLDLHHCEQDQESRLATDALVLATGYRERPLDPLLGALADAAPRDTAGRLLVDDRYRLTLAPDVSGSVHVLGAERHTHGVGTPDLGLVAHRAAVILNTLTGGARYPLPVRTAFTAFGLRGAHAGGGRRREAEFAVPPEGQALPRQYRNTGFPGLADKAQKSEGPLI
ncbi:lysine N(6)-hydroxylase/L-ornithine N(5)-oxygenase family protein [Streptomyces avicenniae]|uniref:lysine N(6)-hydroxylase/L-ornithine N(5)-oxygenase family protein n=1 Tax=Streptomyces avicenniae TaxID=500153 RepID=UPI000B0631A0|nr:SidA/IucD/PvdA family monooxygenase [Streptomyces avicenniae]